MSKFRWRNSCSGFAPGHRLMDQSELTSANARRETFRYLGNKLLAVIFNHVSQCGKNRRARQNFRLNALFQPGLPGVKNDLKRQRLARFHSFTVLAQKISLWRVFPGCISRVSSNAPEPHRDAQRDTFFARASDSCSPSMARATAALLAARPHDRYWLLALS